MQTLQALRITNIQNIQTILQPAGLNATVRSRKHFGLSFCKEGRITYAHNRKEYISSPSYAILHPMGASYDLRVERSGQFPLINFDCADAALQEFMVIPLSNPEAYLRQFEQMQQLALFHQDDLKLLGLFYDMLSQLSREVANKALPLGGLITYMEENLWDPTLNNNRLAEKAGFSEVYFRRLFTKDYGIPPRQYLLELRIKKARQLLTDSDLSVTAISEACGFSGLYHFSRSFTAKVGLSPTEYARKNRPNKI